MNGTADQIAEQHRSEQHRSMAAGRRRRLRGVVFGSVMVAATVATYAPVVDGPFLYDDIPYVVRRPMSHLPDLSLNSLRALVSVKVLQPHRWLSHLSFALNFYAFGDSPTSFHVTNVVIHLLTTLGVFLLCRLSFIRLGLPADRASLASLASAAVFALHPLQTQAVSYIWQRTASLVTCWTVWSVWLFAMGRQRSPGGWWLYALSAWCVAAAVTTKQNGILTPFLMLLYHFVFFTPRDRRSATRHGAVLGAAVVAGLLVVTVLWSSWGWSGLLDFSRRDFSLGQRLLTQSRVMWHYVLLILFPHPGLLNIDHHVIPSTGLFSPWTTLVSLLGLLAVIGFSVWSLFRWPGIGFGLVWYWVCHVPEGTIIPLELMFEHRCYMPLVGLSLVAGLGFEAACRRWRGLSYAGLSLLCMLYGLSTFVRNGVYTDAETLWRDAVAKSPNKARPHIFLGTLHVERKEFRAAEAEFRKAVEANPRDRLAQNNLGRLLMLDGRLAEGISHLRRAIEVDPTFGGGYANLVEALLKAEEYAELVEAARQVLSFERPERVPLVGLRAVAACGGLADELQSKGKHVEAEKVLRDALEFLPAVPPTKRKEVQYGIFLGLGKVLVAQGAHEKAVKQLRTALQLGPMNTNVGLLLGEALRGSQQWKQAEEVYRRVLLLDAGRPELYEGLVEVFIQQGRHEDAVSVLRNAVRRASRKGAFIRRLAWILATAEEENLRNGAEALRLAEGLCRRTRRRNSTDLLVLSAALAESGSFAAAIATAAEAGDVAAKNGNNDLAGTVDKFVVSYRQDKPIRKPIGAGVTD